MPIGLDPMAPLMPVPKTKRHDHDHERGPIVSSIHRLLPLLILLCAALLSPAHAKDEALPSVELILERYIDALGGRGAIERLRTRAMTGRMVTDLPSRTPPVHAVDTLEIQGNVSGGFLSISRTSSGRHAEGWTGEVGWKQDVSGVTLDARVRLSHVALLANPQSALQLRDYFPHMSVAKKTWLDERSQYIVDTGRGFALHFDAESGLLARIGFHRELHDYREIDGVQIPFRLLESRKDGSSTLIIDRVEHNVAIDSRRFNPPQLVARALGR